MRGDGKWSTEIRSNWSARGSRRVRIPRVLTAEEIRSLLAELKEPYRTMVLVAACIGLRVSEIVGLQWGDFDWENRPCSYSGPLSRPASATRRRKVLPAAATGSGSCEAFEETSRAAVSTRLQDWVFANDAGKPRWQETILERQLKPAAVTGRNRKDRLAYIPSHLLDDAASAGADIKVQQELLRHANIQTTMNIYTQAVSEQKRAANSKVVSMVLPSVQKVPPIAGLSLNGS